MTTPDLSGLIPTKYKTYVAIIGGALGLFVPQLLELTADLPQPWPLVIGGIIWVLTVFGVYKAPYAPTGAVLAPAETPGIPGPTGTVVDGVLNVQPEYPNPYRQ